MHISELQAALKGDLIEVQYQPIVRLRDRIPVAVEALARLRHPVHGTMLPDLFIPQMEDAGLAPELTDTVAARALADMAGPFGRDGMRVTLNFPLDVLLVPDALARLDSQRAAADVPANRIVLELTESRPVRDFDRLRQALLALRRHGYNISIDDVSPEVPDSPLLIELPFTSIKLDKDVVQRSHKAGVLAFIRETIELAKAHKLAVVAEGVEDVATWRFMQDLGVDCAQGFLIAYPMGVADVPAWLADWNARPAF